MTQDWTPVAVREGKTKPNPHGGNLTAYYVDFIGADGTEVGEVYWQRKEGNAPEVNRPVFGTISQGQYGPRFKLERRDEQPQRPPPVTTAAPESQPQMLSGPDEHGFVRPADYVDPQVERQRRIERQHSQEMALRTIAPALVGMD